MVLPIGEPEADAIAVASEECERREPVCQPPWKLTQLSSASTLRAPAGDERAVARCRRSAPLRSALPPTTESCSGGANTGRLQLGNLSAPCLVAFRFAPVYAHMNGPIVNGRWTDREPAGLRNTFLPCLCVYLLLGAAALSAVARRATVSFAQPRANLPQSRATNFLALCWLEQASDALARDGLGGP